MRRTNLKKEFFAENSGPLTFTRQRPTCFQNGADRGATASKGNMKTIATARPAIRRTPILPSLGVYGFNEVELVILAALVTEDPLLLVGKSGTGKTFLLNSISEALELNHRHYNASLVSFDDLVGFPFPDDAKTEVRFLETPATIWGAESVLVDEISRCRPEHQNRLFSLIQERRIQGMALESLRFRWAAMNPCTAGEADDYIGSEPLDQALADRFGLLVQVGDWSELTKSEQCRVAHPAGDGAVSGDGGRLKEFLNTWREEYLRQLPRCPHHIIRYVCTAASLLGEANIRVSPRRVRIMCRSLLAASIVAGEPRSETVFRLILECSLPHSAWGETPRAEAVAAAHRTAWDSAVATGKQKWLHQFHLERSLAEKARLLLQSCPNPDVGTTAVAQLLGSEAPDRAAAFALAVYPAAAAGRIPSLGAEAVSDLGRVAQPILQINAEISWREPIAESNTLHPEIERMSGVLNRLQGARRERAQQLFYSLVASKTGCIDPEKLESEFDACVQMMAKEALAR